MNVIATMGIVIAVLLLLLIAVVNIALNERKEKLAYKSEAQRKTNTIDYLYKHFEELDRINKESEEDLQELNDAETKEDVYAVIGRIVERNNDKLRDDKKK